MLKLFSPISKSLINSAHLNSNPRSIHSYIFLILRGSHLPLLIVAYHLAVFQSVLWLCPLPHSYLFSLKRSNGGSLWKAHWKLRKIKCLGSFNQLFQQLFPKELRKPIFLLLLLLRAVWRKLRLYLSKSSPGGECPACSRPRGTGAVRGAERALRPARLGKGASPGPACGAVVTRGVLRSCSALPPSFPPRKTSPGWVSSRVLLEVQQMCPTVAMKLWMRWGWDESCYQSYGNNQLWWSKYWT